MKQYKPFEKQKLFREAFRSGKFKFLLYGGGVRSGKSYNQITMLTALCLKYPRTRFAILRKTLTNLKRTSLKTFQKICFDLNFIENTHYKINRQDLVVTFYNGSQLEFIEADIGKDPELNKLRGLEIDGALLEECNEMSEDVFNVIIQRIGQWSTEFKKRGFVFLNCNPSQGWVKAKFYDKWVNNELTQPFYYQPALPTDNPHNTEEYLESLKELPDADYKTYVLGDWGAFEETNQLIKEAWINECTVATYTSQTNNIYLGVDVAREGDDRSVITFFDGTCFFKQLGAVLTQDNRPIAFFSRKLSDAQSKYTVTELELLAIVETLKEFNKDIKATTGILSSPNRFCHFPQLSFGFPRLIAQLTEFDC